MPNHFHLLIVPNKYAGDAAKAKKTSAYHGDDVHQEKLSLAIGSLLSRYTQAINNRYNRSGSLFRANTKAKDGWINEVISVEGKNKKMFSGQTTIMHCNAFTTFTRTRLKRILRKATDWIYSSARDYAGKRNGTLCNKALAREILGMG